MTPTARSLAECRKRGWTAQVVERFNSYTKRRVDLFGCIDIVACKPPSVYVAMGETCVDPASIIGIQATSNNGGNHASRAAKIAAEPRMKAWANAGGKILIWSWAKRGPRGKAKRWTLREEAVTL